MAGAAKEIRMRYKTIREWLETTIVWAKTNLTSADLECDKFHVAMATPENLKNDHSNPIIQGTWPDNWSYFTWPLVGGWLIIWRKYA